MGVIKMSNEYQEPNFDVAQLLHVEILSPTPKETVEFFTKFLSLEVVEESGKFYLFTRV